MLALLSRNEWHAPHPYTLPHAGAVRTTAPDAPPSGPALLWQYTLLHVPVDHVIDVAMLSDPPDTPLAAYDGLHVRPYIEA
jgi:hypothetical protein